MSFGLICEDCRHFNTNENYPDHLGWCELELPRWLYSHLNVTPYDVVKTVRKDDSCHFIEVKK